MKNDLELVSSRIFVLFVNFLLCVRDGGGVCVRMLPTFTTRKASDFLVRRIHYASGCALRCSGCGKGDDLKHVCVGGCIFAVHKLLAFMPKRFYEKRPSATLNETCKSKQLSRPSSLAAVKFVFRLTGLEDAL